MRMNPDVFSRLAAIEESCLEGEGISREEAVFVVAQPGEYWPEIFKITNKVRQKHQRQEVRLCSIVNAKSGRCSENCKFCAQSAHYKTESPIYALKSLEELKENARAAQAAGASCFSIVTSGDQLRTPEEKEVIRQAVEWVAEETNLSPCVSIGGIDEEFLARLKEAGLKRVHHNLETSAEHFPQICTTHEQGDRVEMLKKIQQNGLEPCSGGIFGVGESEKDWISLAFQLRELGIQSIPINALSPIAGTPFQARCKLEPEQMLKIVALFRLIHPTARLIIAGGREMTMGDRQEELFTAGASGILIGNYLTTPGRPAEEDHAMLEKLGLCGEPEKITVR
jgi:biotin synthase